LFFFKSVCAAAALSVYTSLQRGRRENTASGAITVEIKSSRRFDPAKIAIAGMLLEVAPSPARNHRTIIRKQGDVTGF
jgi:hypothetical protein